MNIHVEDEIIDIRVIGNHAQGKRDGGNRKFDARQTLRLDEKGNPTKLVTYYPEIFSSTNKFCIIDIRLGRGIRTFNTTPQETHNEHTIELRHAGNGKGRRKYCSSIISQKNAKFSINKDLAGPLRQKRNKNGELVGNGWYVLPCSNTRLEGKGVMFDIHPALNFYKRP